jgi:hypothetical protein
MELPVLLPSVAMLRLLWLVHISKGQFSVEWPAHVDRNEHIKLVLRLGARRVVLPSTVRSCVPVGRRYHVNLILYPLTDVIRHELESALSMPEPLQTQGGGNHAL